MFRSFFLDSSFHRNLRDMNYAEIQYSDFVFESLEFCKECPEISNEIGLKLLTLRVDP